MFPGQFFFQTSTYPVRVVVLFPKSECQGGKPLQLVLKTLVSRGWGSDPQPPTQKADALPNRLPLRLHPMVIRPIF